MRTYFSSESVTNGHPDKVCDQIADALLDAIIAKDPKSHVAIEVTVVNNKVHIMGEVTTQAHIDYEKVARKIIYNIGYDDEKELFNAMSCEITIDVHQQSPDIAQGVNKCVELDTGAGDQGMMFGYACKETPSYMPLSIELAHRLTKRLQFVRENDIIPYLKPDGKAQVTMEYEDGKIARISTVVISCCHQAHVNQDVLRNDVIEKVALPVLPEELIDDKTSFFINPTGRFVIGGPEGDSGLTGRKIIVDTYGGHARHGGGAFSGKDPTKVDRTGAYAARYIAKNIVAAGLADRCEVQLAYAIGLADPVSIYVETFGTNKVDEQLIQDTIIKNVDLRPQALIEKFNLRTPLYEDVSCYGHFGLNAANKPWEQLDLVNTFKGAIS